MAMHRQQSPGLTLSTDLWAKIFTINVEGFEALKLVCHSDRVSKVGVQRGPADTYQGL